MHRRFVVLACGLLALAGVMIAACATGSAPPAAPAAASPSELQTSAKQVFAVLPAEATSERNPVTDAKITLGRMLYYDARLSKNHDVSCNSCHQLDRFGVDGEATSPGHRGQRGDRSSPSTYNAALHVAQFWDGRAATVEDQAKGPVLNPIEMAMPSEQAVIALLKSVPGYAPLFKAAFPERREPITYDGMADAIGAFERRLITPGRFDRFLQGDLAALRAAEQAGLAEFMSTGCTACHNGAAVGGASFQKLGAVKPYDTKDVGREKVTKNAADRFVFRVPSLRNIARTGPWFHDGSVETLDEAIALMARHQLGRELTAQQIASIASFLGSLTGEIPTTYVAKPELPKSGPKTPKPDPR